MNRIIFICFIILYANSTHCVDGFEEMNGFEDSIVPTTTSKNDIDSNESSESAENSMKPEVKNGNWLNNSVDISDRIENGTRNQSMLAVPLEALSLLPALESAITGIFVSFPKRLKHEQIGFNNRHSRSIKLFMKKAMKKSMILAAKPIVVLAGTDLAIKGLKLKLIGKGIKYVGLGDSVHDFGNDVLNAGNSAFEWGTGGWKFPFADKEGDGGMGLLQRLPAPVLAALLNFVGESEALDSNMQLLNSTFNSTADANETSSELFGNIGNGTIHENITMDGESSDIENEAVNATNNERRRRDLIKMLHSSLLAPIFNLNVTRQEVETNNVTAMEVVSLAVQESDNSTESVDTTASMSDSTPTVDAASETMSEKSSTAGAVELEGSDDNAASEIAEQQRLLRRRRDIIQKLHSSLLARVFNLHPLNGTQNETSVKIVTVAVQETNGSDFNIIRNETLQHLNVSGSNETLHRERRGLFQNLSSVLFGSSQNSSNSEVRNVTLIQSSQVVNDTLDVDDKFSRALREHSMRMKLSSALKIAEAMKLQDCVYRFLCKGSCDPATYGNVGPKVERTLSQLRLNGTIYEGPEYKPYRDAMEAGHLLKGKDCNVECTKIYDKCNRSQSEIEKVAEHIDLDN